MEWSSTQPRSTEPPSPGGKMPRACTWRPLRQAPARSRNLPCFVSGTEDWDCVACPLRRPAMGSPRILAVGTAVPPTSFTQDELVDIFGYADPLRRSFFLRSGIERRHFFVDATQVRPDEDVDQLAARFERGSVTLGVQAIQACLARAQLDVAQVDFLATT